MPKLPSLQFYPKDWLGDPVSWCSLAAQGLWLRMLFIMHDSGRYGHLCNRDGSPLPPVFVAKACGIDLVQYECLLAELDAAGIPSRNRCEVIFSRRLLRDQERRKQFSKSKAKLRKETASNRVHTVSTQCPPSLHLQSAFASIKQEQKPPPVSVEEIPEVPLIVPTEVWEKFVKYRKEKSGKVLKPSTIEYIGRKLLKLKADGYDPVEIIEQTIENGWTGLFAITGGKENGNGRNGRGPQTSTEHVDQMRRNAKVLGLDFTG